MDTLRRVSAYVVLDVPSVGWQVRPGPDESKGTGCITRDVVQQQQSGYHPYVVGRGREWLVQVDLESRGSSSREHS